MFFVIIAGIVVAITAITVESIAPGLIKVINNAPNIILTTQINIFIILSLYSPLIKKIIFFLMIKVSTTEFFKYWQSKIN